MDTRISRRRLLALLAGATPVLGSFPAALRAQNPQPPVPADTVVYFCPMDPDIRTHSEGNCPRCGMKMVSGLPEPVEYHVDLRVSPAPLKAGQQSHIRISIHDPWKNNPVRNFQIVHEKLLHMFVVSEDLKVFLHDHPSLGIDGDFHYDYVFPQSGMYRVLGDFYPDAATPQLSLKTVMVSGSSPKPVLLSRDYSTKSGTNLQATLETVPSQPIAGMDTQMHFNLSPADGIEKYLGAWAHMLAGSDDLVDMMHSHPFIADGGPQLEFKVVFPRARTYRVWVQFQRRGVVNTVHFDVPVKTLQ